MSSVGLASECPRLFGDGSCRLSAGVKLPAGTHSDEAPPAAVETGSTREPALLMAGLVSRPNLQGRAEAGQGRTKGSPGIDG